MEILWVVKRLGVRDRRKNFGGIVKGSICRIKARASVNTTGTTGDA